MRLLVVMMALSCSSSGPDKTYYVPVDTPARPFTPPETEDLIDDDGDAWADDDGSGDGSSDDDRDAHTNTNAAEPEAAVQAISMTLMQSRRAFEGCYTKALERAPTLRGRVELVLQVGGDGTPIAAKATGLPGVAPCVAQVAKGLIYPKPSDGKTVTIAHPFVFAPSN
jgi:hypothetical protein